MVLAEHTGGQISDGTHELIAKAHELAAALGGLTEVALIGRTDLAGQLGAADVVVAVEDPALSEYLPEAYEQTLLEVLAQRSPRLLLMSNGTIGLDLAAALLGALGGAAGDLRQRTADRWRRRDRHCTDPRRQSTRRRRAVRRARHRHRLGGASAPRPAPSSRDADVVRPRRRRRGSTRRACRFDRSSRPTGETSTSARLTCSSRWAEGSSRRTTWSIVEELADVLGVPLSASRPIDAGWPPKTRQVGQSGLKVKPGSTSRSASPALPSTWRTRNAELIIACNTDPRSADLRRRPLRHDR